MSAMQTFTEMYEKMKQGGGFKPGNLVILSGRQTGKSWVQQQYMTQFWVEPKTFDKLESDKVTDGRVLCDVNQDIVDWLMKEFEPGRMWQYATSDTLAWNEYPIPFKQERVIMHPEVYTALVLRWS
jgi:hypothetical protein